MILDFGFCGQLWLSPQPCYTSSRIRSAKETVVYSIASEQTKDTVAPAASSGSWLWQKKHKDIVFLLYLGTSWPWVRDNLGTSWLGRPTSWLWVRVDCKPLGYCAIHVTRNRQSLIIPYYHNTRSWQIVSVICGIAKSMLTTLCLKKRPNFFFE